LQARIWKAQSLLQKLWTEELIKAVEKRGEGEKSKVRVQALRLTSVTPAIRKAMIWRIMF
jgi:hypothetical protein